MAIGLPELFLLIGVCIVIVGVSIMYLIDKLNKVSIFENTECTFNKPNKEDDMDWSYVACGRPKKLYEKYKQETLDKYKGSSIYDDNNDIYNSGIR